MVVVVFDVVVGCVVWCVCVVCCMCWLWIVKVMLCVVFVILLVGMFVIGVFLLW